MNKCFMMPCHMHSNFDHEGFLQALNHESFSLMHLETRTLPLDEKTKEDLRCCKEAKRYALVNFNRLLTENEDRPYHRPLKENWKELLDETNKNCLEAGGEYFWGYLLDEPFYYFTSEEFIEVTKYMSRFGKRIYAVHASVHIHNALWPINESHDFKATAFRNMAKITPENHAYVTDVGYDYYGEWEHGVHHNTVFRLFIEKMGHRFNETKFWFTPPVGTVLTNEWAHKSSEEVEKICLDVFMGMWNWACGLDNFGGFFLYTYYIWVHKNTGYIHGGAKAYLLPDENGEVKWKTLYSVLEAVGKGFNEGKTPAEIELPEVEYDKGYIV